MTEAPIPMISPESWARLKPILDSALELTQEDRPAYLDQVCGDDPELREEAERMLRACEQGRRSLGFLDSPATDLGNLCAGAAERLALSHGWA